MSVWNVNILREYAGLPPLKKVEEVAELHEGARLINKILSNNGEFVAKVYRNSEYDEFFVKFERGGKQLFKSEESDGLSYADSREDAEGQAREFITRADTGDTFGESYELKESTTASAIATSIPVLFTEPDTHTDNTKEREDATGASQDEETVVKVPKELFKQIDTRISEIKDSMDQYDKVKYSEQASYKENAQDCLLHIKELLQKKNLAGFKAATIYYGTIASHISGLFPAKLITFLHTGMEQKNEVPTTSFGKDAKDKLSIAELPNQADVGPRDDSVYPQKTDDQKPK